jgi:hypothetical protein
VIPIAWLMGASDDQLLHFETARLNKAAILEKEAKAMREEADDQRIEAGVAAWIREHRTEILQSTGKHLERMEDVRKREVA